MKLKTTLVAVIVATFASTASAQLLVAKDGPIVYGHHHIAAFIEQIGDAETRLTELDAP